MARPSARAPKNAARANGVPEQPASRSAQRPPYAEAADAAGATLVQNAAERKGACASTAKRSGAGKLK